MYAGEGSTLSGTVVFSSAVSVSVIALPAPRLRQALDVDAVLSCSDVAGDRLVEEISDSVTVDVTVSDASGILVCAQPATLGPVGQLNMTFHVKMPDVRDTNLLDASTCIAPCTMGNYGALMFPYYVVAEGNPVASYGCLRSPVNSRRMPES